MGARSSVALLAALAARGCRLRRIVIGRWARGEPATAALPSRARRAARSRSWPRRTSTTSTPGRPTTRSATRSPTRRSGRCTRSSPTTPRRRCPTSPRATRRSPTDNKTITVKLRSGVKFSPPVNREVTSKDVKYAFERAFTAERARRATPPPTSATSRARRTAPGKFKTIPGIKTPDDRTIVLRARQADRRHRRGRAGDADHDPGAARSTRRSSTRKSPSTYDQYTVFTGPVHGPQRRRAARSSAATRAS